MRTLSIVAIVQGVLLAGFLAYTGCQMTQAEDGTTRAKLDPLVVGIMIDSAESTMAIALAEIADEKGPEVLETPEAQLAIAKFRSTIAAMHRVADDREADVAELVAEARIIAEEMLPPLEDWLASIGATVPQIELAKQVVRNLVRILDRIAE